MTTTARRGLVAVALALVMLVLPATTALAQTELISGVWTLADRNPDRIIPASFPTYREASECVFDDCENREDVMFVNVDISDAMEDYEDYADFYVVNGFVSTTTYWFVCSYDDSGSPIDCFYDEERSWGMQRELSSDARELRLFPIQSPATEYYLYTYVE